MAGVSDRGDLAPTSDTVTRAAGPNDAALGIEEDALRAMSCPVDMAGVL